MGEHQPLLCLLHGAKHRKVPVAQTIHHPALVQFVNAHYTACFTLLQKSPAKLLLAV